MYSPFIPYPCCETAWPLCFDQRLSLTCLKFVEFWSSPNTTKSKWSSALLHLNPSKWINIKTPMLNGIWCQFHITANYACIFLDTHIYIYSYRYLRVYPGPFIHPAQIVQRKILSLLSYWLSIVILSQVLVQQTVPSWLCRLLVLWGCRLPCLFWTHQGDAIFNCYRMRSWWLSNSCAGQWLIQP